MNNKKDQNEFPIRDYDHSLLISPVINMYFIFSLLGVFEIDPIGQRVFASAFPEDSDRLCE